MKGVYALEIQLSKDASIAVGALGEVEFKKGKYFYIGSAQNNLKSRVKRHLRKEKKTFWHIDYFLNNEFVKVKRVHFAEAEKEFECKIAQQLSSNGIPIAKFGCSDCNCPSHLFTQVTNSRIIKSRMQILDLQN